MPNYKYIINHTTLSNRTKTNITNLITKFIQTKLQSAAIKLVDNINDHEFTSKHIKLTGIDSLNHVRSYLRIHLIDISTGKALHIELRTSFEASRQIRKSKKLLRDINKIFETIEAQTKTQEKYYSVIAAKNNLRTELELFKYALETITKEAALLAEKITADTYIEQTKRELSTCK